MRLCALAVTCCIVGATLGHAVGGMSAALRLGGLALVLGGVLGLLGEAVELLMSLGVYGTAAEYAVLMLRGLSIAVLCRLCADICRDCGQAAAAGAVESAGKLAVIILALPTAAELFETVSELLEEL